MNATNLNPTNELMLIDQQPTDLATLCEKHLKVKEELRLKQLELDAINAEISKHYQTGIEGSKAYKFNGYTVTVETRINRKIDVEKLNLCQGTLPEGVELLKPTLNESVWKQFKRKYSDIAESILNLGAVEESYGKIGVRVTL